MAGPSNFTIIGILIFDLGVLVWAIMLTSRVHQMARILAQMADNSASQSSLIDKIIRKLQP